MGSKWRKVLERHLCVYLPETLEDSPATSTSAGRFSDVSSPPPALSPTTRGSGRPTTPTPSSSGLRLSFGGPKSSSKKTCAICLTTMKQGQGHAIFTAECSHTFHFHCITSNVKHGNQKCPVCRATWKEIPFQNPASGLVHWPQSDAWMTVLRRLPPPTPRVDSNRQISSLFNDPEPSVFDDDEILDPQPEIAKRNFCVEDAADIGKIEVQTFPEVSSVPKSTPCGSLTVLVHLKAPLSSRRQHHCKKQTCLSPVSHNSSRGPVDLVTILDVSGSMAGTKLALLKRAMGFVIQNLGPSDRLSVIAFSSTARRLFPLRRMTTAGCQLALHAVNSLTSNGGTNIAEALKKGVKVMVDRKSKNPVSSIILLSDGQDTYTAFSPGGGCPRTNYQSLLPPSIQQNGGSGSLGPIHTFGFGVDHDAASMHLISETSGGTFSFIEAESVIQDAFAQCIGGLLSVVVQELQVRIECADPGLQLGSIKAGGYETQIVNDARTGFVDGGDLYAEEERDFLVTVDIPVTALNNEISLFKVRCDYRDPITKELVTVESPNEVKIRRPEIGEERVVVSMELDRQRNRLQAAEAMSAARAEAEHGNLNAAVAVLESFRRTLSETVSAKAGDRLCVALDAELKEMQQRMSNRSVYEASGRAYVLSGLSSHSWQRATARGDSTDSTSLVQSYQTPSMVNMVTRSQTMVFSEPPARHQIRPVQSFPSGPLPR